jgi:Ca-activated chloride channel family protein
VKLRLAIIVLALLAVGGALVAKSHKKSASPTLGGTATASTVQQPAAPSSAIRISMAFSPEKEDILRALIARYDGQQHKVNGRPVYVVPDKESSGAAESAIVKGTLKPTIWSPAGSLWGGLVNYELDKPITDRTNDSIIRTPLVIAMWEPLARALGWPRKALGFADILHLATSGAGWAQYGKPTYGQFRLGHTNPDFSTSGLEFVTAQYYTAAGKLTGLTEAQVKSKAVRTKVAAIERSIVHYGDTTLFFEDQLKKYGPTYASAVAMEETTLLDFNRTRPKGMPKLVALYPKEGTFVSDSPFMILNASWVSADQKAAAQDFHDWLLPQITPQMAAKYGFRAGNAKLKPVAPITKANGVDPAEPKRVLALPEPRVLARIKAAWHADRKPANIELVVDVSGSMSDQNKLGQAKQGLQVFLKQLSPRDRVGLLYFDDRLHVGQPIAPFKQDRAALVRLVGDLQVGGSTALYDAAAQGYAAVDALKDDTRINAVVLLTDGQDTASRHESEKSLVARLKQRSEGEGRQIRVFTIAYGADASASVLTDIAAASGGEEFAGDPAKIDAVYLQISSFF